ncbi:MAG: NAD(P)H-hydrate dehydratase [Lachnospiraceae bacterium]|nr:NAD(P)H-hydrate dehydratase [Lachnospiraceae bacterium]
MNYALTSSQMKACDENTAEHFGLSSLILQERAALAVCDYISQELALTAPQEILIYAGDGNNGADALACARILTERGHRVRTRLTGSGNNRTPEWETQKRILDAYGIGTEAFAPKKEAEAVPGLILDGMLGAGLTRALAGRVKEAAEEIGVLRERGARVIAIDLPTGVHADDGQVQGCAVRADHTVTFAFAKTGLLLYPGAEYAGTLTVADIGITEASFLPGTEKAVVPAACYYGAPEQLVLPQRKPDGNKGTFGKVLVIAGSGEISGAAILCATAALRSGCGMVKVLTHRANREVLALALPEAMCTVYDDTLTADDPVIRKALDWADVIVLGPGIGTGQTGRSLTGAVLDDRRLPLVADADALNLMAADRELFEKARVYAAEGRPFLVTPHLREFARLFSRATGQETDAKECAANLLTCPRRLSAAMHATVLCKDARSIVADETKEQCYINLSGHAGMATAGAGDVLAGLCGALLAQGMNGFEAAATSAYLHGLSGDNARDAIGESAMLAGDIAARLSLFIEQAGKEKEQHA